MSNRTKDEITCLNNARERLTAFFAGEADYKSLVFDFFIAFSRFEYALKRANYLQHPNGRAEPDWEAFAKAMHHKFVPEMQENIKKSLKYLKENPARQQVVNNGELGWKDMSFGNQDCYLWKVLKIVKTTRNNLFHGGKYPVVEICEPSRDNTLLESCIDILNVCIELDVKVREYY